MAQNRPSDPSDQMATGWCRAVIKEVPSGDTLVVSAGKPGAAEKRITLSSVVAPKLVSLGAGVAQRWSRAPPRPCACRLAGLP